jgi:shikimate kinase
MRNVDLQVLLETIQRHDVVISATGSVVNRVEVKEVLEKEDDAIVFHYGPKAPKASDAISQKDIGTVSLNRDSFYAINSNGEEIVMFLA